MGEVGGAEWKKKERERCREEGKKKEKKDRRERKTDFWNSCWNWIELIIKEVAQLF